MIQRSAWSVRSVRAVVWVVGALSVLAACSTVQEAPTGAMAGTADAFTPGDYSMSAGPDWGTAPRIATFTPGVMWEGVESIEIEMPYGETTVTYNFSGYPPNSTLEVTTAVNFDFFMQDSFIYFSYVPGYHNASDITWPRPWVSDEVQHKWIDSVGRFAGEPWPDATEGWEEVTGTVQTDENGDATLVMMVNHWTESPPLVYAHFRNPEVRLADNQ